MPRRLRIAAPVGPGKDYYNYRFSHILIERVTMSDASCWTKCPALGIVTSVRSLSSHSQVLLSAPGSSAGSSRPWIISTGILTFTTGDVSSLERGRTQMTQTGADQSV